MERKMAEEDSKGDNDTTIDEARFMVKRKMLGESKLLMIRHFHKIKPLPKAKATKIGRTLLYLLFSISFKITEHKIISSY